MWISLCSACRVQAATQPAVKQRYCLGASLLRSVFRWGWHQTCRSIWPDRLDGRAQGDSLIAIKS